MKNVPLQGELITPEKAAALLSTSDGNRPIRNPMVARFAADMAAGKWMLNGEAIIISVTGKLMEGHHRLWACIRSNTPFLTAVTYGVADSAFATINTGGVRSPGDVFAIAGVQNGNKVSSLIAKTVHYKYSVGSATVNPWSAPYALTKTKLLELYEADADAFEDANSRTIRLYQELPSIVPSIAGGMHYLFATVNQHLADDFMERLITGANMNARHPAMMLRKVWMKRAKDKRRSGPTEMMVTTCHAWNAFRKGRELGLLRHNVDHPVPDYR